MLQRCHGITRPRTLLTPTMVPRWRLPNMLAYTTPDTLPIKPDARPVAAATATAANERHTTVCCPTDTMRTRVKHSR